MAKIDLLLTSGITAMDGSVVESGATLKFDSEFTAASTSVKIIPRLYRNRTLFENGYSNIPILESVIPYDFIITIEDINEFYQLTPQQLYERVCVEINNIMGDDYFEISITE